MAAVACQLGRSTTDSGSGSLDVTGKEYFRRTDQNVHDLSPIARSDPAVGERVVAAVGMRSGERAFWSG